MRAHPGTAFVGQVWFGPSNPRGEGASEVQVRQGDCGVSLCVGVGVAAAVVAA